MAEFRRGSNLIIVDRALARRETEGDRIRVAMIGAGAIGRGIALQVHRRENALSRLIKHLEASPTP